MNVALKLASLVVLVAWPGAIPVFAGQEADRVQVATPAPPVRTVVPPPRTETVRIRRGLSSGFQESRRGPELTETFNGTYRLASDGVLDLNQIAGSIRVTGGREGGVRLDAVKRVRHRDPDEARRLLSSMRIEVTQSGNRLEVRTEYPRNVRNVPGSVDFTIAVPESMSLTLKTVSGDVMVSGVAGEVRLESISGNVDAVATTNLTMAKTVSGDVRARDVAATSLSLGTLSGNVIATALKARALDAGSVSGNVQLDGLQVDRVVAKTLSGNISFAGSLSRGGRYEFNAHSGDVRLVLARDTAGFEVDASTFSGAVRSDFTIATRSGPDPRGRGPMRAVRGTYADPVAVLLLRTFSGSVVIARAETP